jgi:hypothetical protein
MVKLIIEVPAELEQDLKVCADAVNQSVQEFIIEALTEKMEMGPEGTR